MILMQSNCYPQLTSGKSLSESLRDLSSGWHCRQVDSRWFVISNPIAGSRSVSEETSRPAWTLDKQMKLATSNKYSIEEIVDEDEVIPLWNATWKWPSVVNWNAEAVNWRWVMKIQFIWCVYAVTWNWQLCAEASMTGGVLTRVYWAGYYDLVSDQ